MKHFPKRCVAALAGIAPLLMAPAHAHHPLGGAPMTTFGDGLLSGLGHPILGFDHLFFIVAVGVAAAFTARRYVAPLAFVGAMLVGVALAAAGLVLPLTEVAIVASVVVLGGLVMRGAALSMPAALGLFAVAGIFHGLAFGAVIAGQEGGAGGAVVAGYLIGLGAIQWALAVAAGLAVTGGLKAVRASDTPARLVGACVAGAGLLLSLEMAEGAVFSALGLG